MELQRIPGSFAVCKLSAMPKGVGHFTSPWHLSVTDDEISLVCHVEEIPDNASTTEAGWSCYRVAGQLDFALTGILARLTGSLANAGVSVFAISTFDTDYLLVKDADRQRAESALSEITIIQ